MSRLIRALASLDSCACMFKNDFAIAISKVAHVIFLLKIGQKFSVTEQNHGCLNR